MVHRAPIGAECKAVGGIQAIDQGLIITIFLIANHAAFLPAICHIHEHCAQYKATLPVTATIVAAHTARWVLDWRKQRLLQ